MPIPKTSASSQKSPVKRTLNPTFFYMKTIKGKQLARMHSKVLTEKFKAQEIAIDKMRKRQALLLSSFQEILGKNKRLSRREAKALRARFVAFEVDLEKVFNKEVEYLLFETKSESVCPTKTPTRIHQLKSILTAAHQELEVLETAGLVEKGFRAKVLEEANIVRRTKK